MIIIYKEKFYKGYGRISIKLFKRTMNTEVKRK